MLKVFYLNILLWIVILSRFVETNIIQSYEFQIMEAHLNHSEMKLMKNSVQHQLNKDYFLSITIIDILVSSWCIRKGISNIVYCASFASTKTIQKAVLTPCHIYIVKTTLLKEPIFCSDRSIIATNKVPSLSSF